MSTHVYQTILDQIQQLTSEEQQQLREDIDRIISSQVIPKKSHNIMEFRGMAKDLWKDVDVQKYIEEERRSWEGVHNVF